MISYAIRTRRRLRAVRGVAPAPRLGRAVRYPRLAPAVLAGAFAIPVAMLAGPVGGAVVAVYVLVVASYGLRRSREVARTRARSRALDALAALAADLRAGLAPDGARAAVQPLVDSVPLVRDRVAAAWRVADVTGAPLADLLDRLEVDLRSLDRVRLAAAAHAAGTRATAGLLAVLPVAGIGVGYGMGADPLHVLLHTPAGAGCVAAAVLLQLAGLAWTGRLSRIGGEVR
jgi:tight adherence protein B